MNKIEEWPQPSPPWSVQFQFSIFEKLPLRRNRHHLPPRIFHLAPLKIVNCIAEMLDGAWRHSNCEQSALEASGGKLFSVAIRVLMIYKLARIVSHRVLRRGRGSA